MPFEVANYIQIINQWQNFKLGTFEVGLFSQLTILFLIILGLLWVFKLLLLSRLQDTVKAKQSELDKAIEREIKSLPLVFYLVFSYYLESLLIQRMAGNYVQTITFVVSLLFLGKILQSFLLFLVNSFIFPAKDGTLSKVNTEKSYQQFTAIILNILFWLSVLFLILYALGVNLNTVVTGFGISTVAIAFALQNILGDIFASFSIYFDKPFLVGDMILIDEEKGVVTKIGLKSTRIKTLAGDELVVPNRQLAGTKLHNFQKMKYRRADIMIPLSFSNTSTLLQTLLDNIPKLIKNMDGIEFQRCNIHKLIKDGNIIELEVVYRIKETDYDFYLKTRQSVTLAVLDEMEKLGVLLSGVVPPVEAGSEV